MDLHSCILLTDSLVATQGIQGLTTITDQYTHLYAQCRDLCEQYDVEICHARREHVGDADLLADWST